MRDGERIGGAAIGNPLGKVGARYAERIDGGQGGVSVGIQRATIPARPRAAVSATPV